MNTTDEAERLVEEMVKASDGGLNANRIAAGVGGQQHRPEVAALARDPEAVLLMRACRHELGRGRRTLLTTLAVAACAVVGVVLGSLVTADGPGASHATAPGDRLVAAVEDLRRADPERFGDFVLPTEAELKAPPAVRRGGAAWRGPRGTLLAPPSALHWRKPAGTTRMRVTLRGPDVDWQRDVSETAIAAPALGPGRYVVTLRALNGLSRQTTRSAFAVAAPEERERYERARAAIAASVPADLADLVEAHYARANGYLEAARAAALRASEVDDLAPLARPLLDALSR